MTHNKKYGLLLPDKTKLQAPTFQASRNVFGNDSDSEDESRNKPILFRPNDNTNRQAKITQEKAILEDPTVYQYDELYDSMVNKKTEKDTKNKEVKKPKYIESLLKSANKRKIENERRIERQIQKDREKEGDEFADKEVFVTSAYKQKLEEMRMEEEKEKREEYLESIGDVTKQRDLGGFYRHLYEQKLGGSDKDKSNKEKQDQSCKEAVSTVKHTSQGNRDVANKRNYRKRKSSSEHKKQLSEGEIEDSDDEINRVNLNDIQLAKKSKRGDENIDADSDFSIDESSDDETEVKSDNNIQKTVQKKDKEIHELIDNKIELKSDNDITREKEIIVEPKIKIDIWKKRTVGEVFEQALKRYYERKASRGT